MWIKTNESNKPHLINCDYVVQFKITSQKVAAGKLYELTALISDANTPYINLFSSTDKEKVKQVFNMIQTSLKDKNTIFEVPNV